MAHTEIRYDSDGNRSKAVYKRSNGFEASFYLYKHEVTGMTIAEFTKAVPQEGSPNVRQTQLAQATTALSQIDEIDVVRMTTESETGLIRDLKKIYDEADFAKNAESFEKPVPNDVSLETIMGISRDAIAVHSPEKYDDD